MVQLLSTKADLIIDATAFTGLADYGQIMIGDRRFESYYIKDPCKFIQIPWGEVDYALTLVMFEGEWIPHCTTQTKKNGTHTFIPEESKRVLQAIREYVDPDHTIQSLSFFDVIKKGIPSIGKKRK